MSSEAWILIAVVAALLLVALVSGFVLYKRRRVSLTAPTEDKELTDRSGGYTASGGFSFSQGGATTATRPEPAPIERTDTDGQPHIGDDAAIPRDAPKRGITNIPLPESDTAVADAAPSTDELSEAAPSDTTAPGAEDVSATEATSTAPPATGKPAAPTEAGRPGAPTEAGKPAAPAESAGKTTAPAEPAGKATAPAEPAGKSATPTEAAGKPTEAAAPAEAEDKATAPTKAAGKTTTAPTEAGGEATAPTEAVAPADATGKAATPPGTAGTAVAPADTAGASVAPAEAAGTAVAPTEAPEKAAPGTPTEAPRTTTPPADTAKTIAGVPTAPVEEIEPTAGRLVRLRGRLSRSQNAVGKSLLGLLGGGDLDEDSWEEVEDTLVLADLGTASTASVVNRLREEMAARSVRTTDQAREVLRAVLVEALRPELDRSVRALPHADHPSILLVVGVNGTGKTTTTGKLARVLVADGRRVLLGAADTFRAAAADQLQTWGERVGAETVRGKEAGDPAAVAFDAVAAGIDRGVDAVLIDTAGRLHTKTGLMDELGKVKRVVEKKAPVDEVLLVLDATVGQNGLTQARVFAEVVDITGVVLTKLDGTAKGGIVFQVQHELGVPVKLVGLGEGADDLAPFEPAAFVDALLG
ncbi:signal recognition particle-docking protein FtsY [Nocardia bovistercoris]|uniref:signal recognition particle-docking protein FtsY n=1 Tax=Nocardia bovistercoris TaxID=2785916 RepID=UPI0038CDAD4F